LTQRTRNRRTAHASMRVGVRDFFEKIAQPEQQGPHGPRLQGARPCATFPSHKHQFFIFFPFKPHKNLSHPTSLSKPPFFLNLKPHISPSKLHQFTQNFHPNQSKINSKNKHPNKINFHPSNPLTPIFVYPINLNQKPQIFQPNPTNHSKTLLPTYTHHKNSVKNVFKQAREGSITKVPWHQI
jgi:hypothetical protein